MDLYCFMLQQESFISLSLLSSYIFIFTVSQLEVPPEFDRYHYLLSFRTCMTLYEAKLKLNCCIYSKSTGRAF